MPEATEAKNSVPVVTSFLETETFGKLEADKRSEDSYIGLDFVFVFFFIQVFCFLDKVIICSKAKKMHSCILMH